MKFERGAYEVKVEASINKLYYKITISSNLIGSFRTLFSPNLLVVLSDNNTLLSDTSYWKVE